MNAKTQTRANHTDPNHAAEANPNPSPNAVTRSPNTDPDPNPTPTPKQVRVLIDERLRARVASELGLPAAELCARAPVYHSFLPQSHAELDAADPRLAGGALARGPWTKAWTKPAPGQLLQAMAEAGAKPHETLMVSP